MCGVRVDVVCDCNFYQSFSMQKLVVIVEITEMDELVTLLRGSFST